jgi:hypothetical protein
MMCVVLDIDDTLINTDTRRWNVWCKVLDRRIPLEVVESLGSRRILETFAFGDRTIWEKYWRILLHWEGAEDESLEHDEPIPFAAQVLQKWSDEYKIVYLTGRSKNMHRLTLDELQKFHFPTSDVDLVMLSLKDWRRYFESKTSLTKLRGRRFSSITERYRVMRVVDDYPSYFQVYKQFKVPDRIGLLRKRFQPKDYLAKGATRVTTW